MTKLDDVAFGCNSSVIIQERFILILHSLWLGQPFPKGSSPVWTEGREAQDTAWVVLQSLGGRAHGAPQLLLGVIW